MSMVTSLRLCMVALALLFAPAAWAQQTGIVAGTVTDAADGRPLAGASVVLTLPGTTGMVHGTATGPDGRFRIASVAPGDYTLAVRFVGFQEVRRPVSVVAGEERIVNFSLQMGGFDLNAVVVTASRQQEKALDAPASISVLEAEEFLSDVTLSPVEALRNTTGVDIAQTGIDRQEVVLRGFNNAFSTSAYVLTDYRQGAIASLGVNGYNFMPINSIDLERVEVVRGPGSALYGPGVDAGVIHFISKDPFTYPGTTVSVAGGERSLISAQARHAGVVGERFGYKVVGSYLQAKDWELDPANDREDFIQDSLFHQVRERDYDVSKLNLNGQIHYRFSPGTTLIASGGFSTAQSVFLSGIGTLQSDGFGYSFGQLRFQSGTFFAQAYLNKNDAGDSFVYAGPGVAASLSGQNIVDKSTLFNVQAQYGLSFLDGRQGLTFGADFERTEPITEGTITGRNEDDDLIVEYGAYVQSETALTPKLDLTLAARADYDNIYEELQLSPRAALVFKPAETHSIRATYNRAFSSPGTNSLFLDIAGREVALPGGMSRIIIQARGTANGITFDNFRQNNTATFSLPVPGAFGQQFNLGQLPLAPIYAAAVGGGLVTFLTSPAPLPSPLPPLSAQQRGLLAQLFGYTAQSGSLGLQAATDAVVLGVPDEREATGFRTVAGPIDIAPLKQSVTQTIELGYKGVIANRLVVAVDGYYTQKKNFVGPLLVESPFAYLQQAGLSADVGAALGALFATTTDPTILALLGQLGQTGLPANVVTQVMAGLVGGALANQPTAIVQSDQPVLPAGTENAVGAFLAYRNFGSIQFYGVDASLQALATDALTLFANLSFVSDNFFDNEELDETNTDLSLALNAPTLKVRGGFDYAFPMGLSVNLAGRYTEGFPVRSGPYEGDVENYFLLDVGAGYDFERMASGLRLDVTVQNVLDNHHREFIGAPRMGRLAMARLTYTF